MKVLVTGSDGYIGVLLVHLLLQHKHYVVGLDTGFYRDGWLYDGIKKPLMHIDRDIRQVTENDLQGFDAVVHLAELANDPLGQRDPVVTYKINHIASVELARKCKNVGVTHFVYTSSCSVYGQWSEEPVTEESATNPQTVYAKCKVFVEKDIIALADKSFSLTILRNATVYGSSPRMRFDLVLNNLAGLAWTTGAISMTSDGTPWRPLVHVLDVCEAIACVLEAPLETVNGQVFNVGRTDGNYQVREIAQRVAETFPNCEVAFGRMNNDTRSYRVSFEKIRTQLPGFACKWDVKRGVQELRELFERVKLSSDVFEFRTYTRLKQIDYLTRIGMLDKELFWRNV